MENNFTGDMDEFLNKRLQEGGLAYKKSLERIINKYSRIQYCDGGIDVDILTIKPRALEKYVSQSEMELKKLESKSITDLREETLGASNITIDSQLDFTYQRSELDEASTSQSFSEDDRMSRSDTTQLTLSSLNESEISFETMPQPEDQDEKLEMTLKSHGSLVELYPSMINRIGRAWHRISVSDAADSVLRRYRKWRQHSYRSNMENTFMVSQSKPIERTSRRLLQENSPERMHYTRAEYSSMSQQSPRWERGLRREQNKPILVMDFSGLPENPNQQQISLNETFTVSALPQLREQSYARSASPSPSCLSPLRTTADKSLRAKRLFLSAHSEHPTACSAFALETTAVKDRPNICGSPVRQSPIKTRMQTDFSASPDSFSRSPKKSCVESFSRETSRSPSLSTFVLSPLLKTTGSMRVPYARDSTHSLQPQLPSPQSAHERSRLRLRRHLSFDSNQPPMNSSSFSPKMLDNDIKKLFHKFVCQNRSSYLNGPPCRLCAEGSVPSQGRFSSALAALALSPHRSVLRKRPRELGWNSDRQSKRSREDYYTYSPGSERYGKERLRHHLSSSKQEQYNDDFSYSSSKHRLTEAWMSQGAGARGIEERIFVSRSSPRKW